MALKWLIDEYKQFYSTECSTPCYRLAVIQ